MGKDLIKSLLRAVAPNYYAVLMTSRSNRHGQWVMRQHGVPEVAASLIEEHGLKVLTGPFAGMAYIDRSIGSSFLPKLVGSYERELHGILGRVLATHYDTVVDVGSAEGFYAVGLAMRLPDGPKVHAFDIDPQAQKDCRDLAVKNGVEDQVVIAGNCGPEELQQTLHGKSLVVCDCEGYELDLLDPKQVPSLVDADLIVELHDVFHPGITPVILERFQASHDVQLIDSTGRDPNDYPEVGFLTPEHRHVALAEYRNGPQQWAYMVPKSRHGAALSETERGTSVS